MPKVIKPIILKNRFNKLDISGKNGNWYKTDNNDIGILAWNESFVMNAYMVMYQTTKDTKYLNKLVDHAKSVLQARDIVRNVTDYRGLSLPAWRAGDKYTISGQFYIFSCHTSMIVYPMADFAQVIYKNPALWSKYKAQADILLKAAKDAVAIHDDEWRQSKDIGWYIFRKGAPIAWDGVDLPFNMLLALARTQLAIWQATHEQVYYDRVKRMTQLFKIHLSTDSTRAYLWHYGWGTFYDGWTAADDISINTPNFEGYPNWEDVSHGAIDIDFAVQAYEAGIVFNGNDMINFGLTIKNKMLRFKGRVSNTVLGNTFTKNPQHIGRWLRLNRWAPSLFDFVYKLSLIGPTGLYSTALLNKANMENMIKK